MKIVIVLAAALILLTGASFPDIHRSVPVENQFIPALGPKKIANCALYNLKSKNAWHPTLLENDDSLVIIVAVNPILGLPINLCELSFTPRDKGTFIELRMNRTFKAQTVYVWNEVLKCTSQNSPGAAISEK
jgi:hypothetical protein